MNQHNHPSTRDIEEALGLSPAKRQSRMRRRVLWLILAVLLFAGLGWYFLAFGQSTGTSAISYETAAVQKTDLVITVSATGTIQPLTQVDIGSEMSGVVREVLVDENDSVKRGQVLAILDPIRMTAERDRNAAQLLGAEARLRDAVITRDERQQQRNRLATLRARGVSSTQEMEAAEAAFARASAMLSVAEADALATKASLKIIAADLSKMQIISPIDGVILTRAVEPGQTVAASLQAPVLFKIAQDLRRIQLEASVDEADIGAVKLGQDASFTVDAYRAQKFPAKIGRLSYAPETIDGVVTYKAILSADNDDLSLRPGMTATARIITESHVATLAIANEALRFQPPAEKASGSFSISDLFMPRFPRNPRGKREVSADGLRSIYVLENGAAKELKIRTGASDGKLTQVLSGDLKLGDAVIIAQKSGAQKSRP